MPLNGGGGGGTMPTLGLGREPGVCVGLGLDFGRWVDRRRGLDFGLPGMVLFRWVMRDENYKGNDTKQEAKASKRVKDLCRCCPSALRKCVMYCANINIADGSPKRLAACKEW